MGRVAARPLHHVQFQVVRTQLQRCLPDLSALAAGDTCEDVEGEDVFEDVDFLELQDDIFLDHCHEDLGNDVAVESPIGQTTTGAVKASPRVAVAFPPSTQVTTHSTASSANTGDGRDEGDDKGQTPGEL